MKNLSIIISLLTGLVLGMGTVQHVQAQSTSTEDAVVTIIEYSDYQCPACAAYHPVIMKLKQQYGDQLNLEYKYYPLNTHQYAALAARAAQAAKNQGKFLPMHNLLFQHQRQWSQSGNPAPMFVNFAKKLNLDIEQFKNDLNAAETQKTVMEQKKEGVRKGVRSTPTFIIEGDIIDPLPRSYGQFDRLIQKYLNEKKQG